MKRNDAVFIFLVGTSTLLTAGVMADHIRTPRVVNVQMGVNASDTNPATQEIRRKLEAMGLTPHEGKYWKVSDE